MNLLEQLHTGIKLIEKGKVLGKDTGAVEDKVKALQGRLNREIGQLKLSEFEQRDIGIEIYSEVLECNLWLCSNDDMKAQIVRDAPGQVCYTTQELRHLIKLNPSREDLKKVHEAIEVFPNSRLNGANKAN